MTLERTRINTVLGGKDAYCGVCCGSEYDGAGREPFYVEDIADVTFELEWGAWLGVTIGRGERMDVTVAVGAAVDEL